MIEVSIQTTSRWLQCSGERELNHSSTALLVSAALSPPLVHRQPPPASLVTDDLWRWWPPSKLTRFKNLEQEQHGQERCARDTGEQGSPETQGEKEFDF